MSAPVILSLYFMGAVALAVCSAPFVIKAMTKLKAKQTVLGYVTQHEHKSGTPTMGGIIFLLPALLFGAAQGTPLALFAAAMTLGFAVLGFLDDFIKIKFSRNLGLKPYQKIIGQVGLSAIAGYFCFAYGGVDTLVNLPFGTAQADMSWGIIPFVMLVYIATTNSVNLTDGLDGLAGYTSAAYFLSFTAILLFAYFDAAEYDAEYAKELLSLNIFNVSVLGGVLGYLVFNGFPAKIMMGDTGSLALGAACASVAVLSKNPFIIVTSGIMFVISSISVILQVFWFKLTKKRIFLMAPFHHHLEMKGLHENRIVAIYFVVSLLGGALSIIGSGAI